MRFLFLFFRRPRYYWKGSITTTTTLQGEPPMSYASPGSTLNAFFSSFFLMYLPTNLLLPLFTNKKEPSCTVYLSDPGLSGCAGGCRWFPMIRHVVPRSTQSTISTVPMYLRVACRMYNALSADLHACMHISYRLCHIFLVCLFVCVFADCLIHIRACDAYDTRSFFPPFLIRLMCLLVVFCLTSLAEGTYLIYIGSLGNLPSPPPPPKLFHSLLSWCDLPQMHRRESRHLASTGICEQGPSRGVGWWYIYIYLCVLFGWETGVSYQPSSSDGWDRG